MVGVEYNAGGNALKREIECPVRVLLGNHDGGYTTLATASPSRYDGFFIFDKEELEMYKILDNFGIPIEKCNLHTGFVDTGSAKYHMPRHTSSLALEARDPVTLNLDIRRSYDLRQWGRIYEIESSGTSAVITFTKKTDPREDGDSGRTEYVMYLAVRHDGTHSDVNAWIRQEYPHDAERGSGPSERYLFSALRIEASHLIIAASKDRKKAVLEAETLFNHIAAPAEEPLHRISGRPEIDMAYHYACAAYDNLMVNGRIFAGLPWFFQFWTRDEAIAVGALISRNQIAEAKEILFRELSFVGPDGRLPNRVPPAGLGAADANGWCFTRLRQIERRGGFDKTERVFLNAKVQYLLEHFQKNYIHCNLIYNGRQETWMDTTVEGKDARDGARIEIQALQLGFYALLYTLTRQDEYVELAKTLKEWIHLGFFDGERLADGLNDYTMRPNIFIAYYAYPELLTKHEWATVFEHALEKLWLPWGGLSSIDKTDPLYHDHHTGENNESYHRGDSWYWINNLAALCMHRLDKTRFKKCIDAILQASTSEILWMGALGTHAEISSASRQESQGCFSQAWSLGLYIELVHEVFR